VFVKPGFAAVISMVSTSLVLHTSHQSQQPKSKKGHGDGKWVSPAIQLVCLSRLPE